VLRATAQFRNPLKGFRFRVKVLPELGSGAGVYVAGVRSVSGLTLNVASFEVWEGGNNFHRYINPTKVNWDPITLEQGLATDDTLEKWARAGLEFLRTGRKPAEPVKRTVLIDVWDGEPFPPPAPQDISREQKMPSRTYRVFNAWVSKYHALPKLDSMASEVALLSVELVHEGWEPFAHAASQATSSL